MTWGRCTKIYDGTIHKLRQHFTGNLFHLLVFISTTQISHNQTKTNIIIYYDEEQGLALVALSAITAAVSITPANGNIIYFCTTVT